jgi:uncharacterized integral membrane protein
MAQPVPRSRPERESPPVDPHAVQRAYRLERAKRRARVERQRARRLAGLRFSIIVVALLVLSIVLVFAVWQQVQRLFGI